MPTIPRIGKRLTTDPDWPRPMGELECDGGVSCLPASISLFNFLTGLACCGTSGDVHSVVSVCCFHIGSGLLVGSRICAAYNLVTSISSHQSVYFCCCTPGDVHPLKSVCVYFGSCNPGGVHYLVSVCKFDPGQAL